MFRYPYIQVDAFSQTPLAGNPCLVVLNADGMPEATMQALARETNLSETAFVLTSTKGDFRARYFTPAEEIPLAGHPTLAVTRALLDTGRIAATTTRFTLELQAGVIPVEINAEGIITMSQKKPVFMKTFDAAEIMPVFGLTVDDYLPAAPIQTVSTGTPQLMILLRNQAALARATLNVPLYTALRARADFFSPHLFCLQGITPQATTFARHFGTPPDTPEDPFTGSATGGMAAYLWRYGLIETQRFIAEQGHWMQRPGQAQIEVIGSREEIETVKVGGYAVTVMEGELRL